MTPYALDHPAVAAYLQRLDAATSHLPEDERIEIQEGIRSHLIAALAEAHTDAEMHQALDAMGSPEEIVGTPPPAAPPANSGRGVLEIIAVIMLLGGAFIIPMIGWFVGVVLLWLSKTWTTGEKLLGTFIVPGGLAAAAILFVNGTFLAVQTCTEVGGGTPLSGGGQQLPPTGAITCSGVPGWVWPLLIASLVIAPIVMSTYLLRVAGRREASAA